MSVQAEIVKKISKLPAGKVFQPGLFGGLGTRASIDQALSRLARRGEIVRIQQGIYVKPGKGHFVARTLPRAEEVARTLAAARGRPVQLHGAEAARQLGLTTQQPAHTVLLTTGLSKPRKIRVGRSEAELRPASERKLLLAGRPAGTAVSALWYLGKVGVTQEVLAAVRQKLGPEEFGVLCAHRAELPQWMREAVDTFEEAGTHGRAIPSPAA